MTFIINSYGELEAVDENEEAVSLESGNEFLIQWLLEYEEYQDD